MSLYQDSTTPKCIGFYRSGANYQSSQIQIDSIERAVKANNLLLIRVRDLSIGEFKNTEAILNELARSKVDCLVIWRLDCLSPFLRSFEEVVDFIVQLSRLNIAVLSVEDKIDSDDEASIFLINLQSAWAELKKNRKIENARNSAIKAQASGNIHKSGRKKKRNDVLIQELRDKGYSIRKIAHEIGFSTTAVQRSLKNANLTSDKPFDLDDSPEV